MKVVINSEEFTNFALLKNSRWTAPLKIDASAEVLDSDMDSELTMRRHFVHCGLIWQAVCLHNAKYLFRIRCCCGRCIFLPSFVLVRVCVVANSSYGNTTKV